MNDALAVSTRALGASKLKLRRCFHLTTASVGVVFGSIACGGSAPEAAAPVQQSTPVEARTSAPPPEPIVIAPEPTDVVVVGRSRTPGPTLAKLGEWAGFPLPWEDFLAQRLPRLTPVLRSDQSADFAVSMDPESRGFPDLYVVFSVALTDYDKANAALRESGEVIASPDAQQVYVEVEDGVECSVFRATASPRLVCGKHVALTTLGAFVATNLSQQQVGTSDLYTELRLTPIYARYGKRAQALKVLVPALLREASLQNARFDTALAAAAHATVDDVLILARELDRVRFSVDLQDTTQQAVVHLDVRFKGADSFLPAALAHAATNSGSAPEMFWSLPDESTSVSFSTFAQPFVRVPAVVDTLGELGAGALEHVGLASGAVERWLSELKAVMTASGASAYAHIPDPEHPHKTLAGVWGTSVLGIEGDAGAVQRFAEASIAVFNDKRLRAEVAKRAKVDAKEVPTVAAKPVPAILGLPAGSREYAFTLPKAWAVEYAEKQLPPELAAKQGPFTLTAMIVKQGERTWVGWGGSESKIAAALKSTLAPPGPDGLAAIPELARWRTASVNSGTSIQVRQLFEPSLFGGEGLTKPAEAELALRSMPNGGKGFVHIKGNAIADGPQATLELEVPRAVLIDLVSAFV
jgi:hypothetical protein